MSYTNKQIIYPKLISRLFATTIDLFILCLVWLPCSSIISWYVSLFVFRDFFISHDISFFNKEAIVAVINTQEFLGTVTFIKVLKISGILTSLNILFYGVFFVGFWRYKGATPGKMLLNMRIVDADTLEKPSTTQLIKRFLGCFLGLIGIWSILFTNKSQALHDKIANTVVIKN